MFFMSVLPNSAQAFKPATPSHTIGCQHIMHKRSPAMTSPPSLPCHTNLPLVGIVCDRFFVGEHDQHGVKESYRRALSDVAGVAPVFLPATSAISDVTPYLRVMSGLLFPGGASNVAPALYGGEEPAGLPLDPARDHVAVQLIRGAVSQGLPMLAIGRGFQEMNVAFGGTLHPDIYAAGYNEHHRENLSEPIDLRYRYKHRVSLAPDGRLHDWLRADVALVNRYICRVFVPWAKAWRRKLCMLTD